MTPSEAKLRILAEWRTWVGHLKWTPDVGPGIAGVKV
jgi:hypothetical protein